MHLWGLVLAGGDGMRLRALTERIAGRPIPKQYCRMLGPRSLLEAALDRVAALVAPERTLVIVNDEHLPFARPQLERLPAANVIVQPANRDTGPGLTLSLLALSRRAPQAVAIVLPSDHSVRDETAFATHIARAVRAVTGAPDRIALLGIVPDRADPELGYIEMADAAPGMPPGARDVARFCEKPDAPEARRIVARGGLWNTFVMVFRVDRMLELLLRVRPVDVARLAWAGGHGGRAAYATLPPWNFSRDFLTSVTPHLIAIPVAGVGWDDCGTPDAVARVLAATPARAAAPGR